MQCKPKSNITESNISDTPPTFNPESIGLNEVKVEGRLIKKNDLNYFIIDKVLLRGRSAPIINNGEEIQLRKIKEPSPPYNKPVKGLLNCQAIPGTDNCVWSFKVINN